MTTYSRRAFIKYSAILPSTILATKFRVARAGGLSHPFFAQGKNRPEVIAHQGGKGQWPGETLYAFEQATKIGVDILELDIRSTKDDQLVVMHNESVDTTTNGRGRVRQFTLKDLQKLDAGFRWTADGGRTFPFRGEKPHRTNTGRTVNDMAGMQRMIALNVDGIITDFPGPLLALLGRSR